MTAQPRPTTLHRVVCISDATSALAALTGTAVVLASCPSEFTVAQQVDGRLRTAQNAAWQFPDSCFQLVAFTAEVELRWLAHPAGGRTVYLAENPAGLPVGAGAPDEPERYAGTFDQQSILWGTPANTMPANGFSAWRAGRIGSAWYPCQVGTTQRDQAVLRYREYVSQDPFGTLSVAETRLFALDVMS